MREGRARTKIMLTSLSIRNVVLIEALDLSLGAGLTVLTGETGAGKSILLDALGLTLGARAEAGLVRPGAPNATATAVFSLPSGHPAFALLAERGLDASPDDDVVLRRQIGLDGRSRAFVNDQPTSVSVLKDLGALLVETHGQHETVGLIDPKSHRGLLDAFASVRGDLALCAERHARLRDLRAELADLTQRTATALAEQEALAEQLAELDRLAPKPGEEQSLSELRAVLGASEKALADLEEARTLVGGDDLTRRLSSGLRLAQRAKERALAAGAGADTALVLRLGLAAEALDRALVEATEAVAALEGAAESFEFDPQSLEQSEERLFALRAMARKLRTSVEDLPDLRVRLAGDLRALDSAEADLKAVRNAVDTAERDFAAAAEALSVKRSQAALALSEAIAQEFAPLKLDKARFRAVVDPQGLERAGPTGWDRVTFEIAANPNSPFTALGDSASGGELARVALALKAALAQRDGAETAAVAMIFDEVDQGVGGAVAEAVGVRLRKLAGAGAQVLVVTHSPQVAARGDSHWRISKREVAGGLRTEVETLSRAEREEEIARMLSGAEISEAARAAARALIG